MCIVTSLLNAKVDFALRWKGVFIGMFGVCVCVTFAVTMQDVQRGDEELVCVLLFVPCQVPSVCPHQVQQPERDVRRAMTGVELQRRGDE